MEKTKGTNINASRVIEDMESHLNTIRASSLQIQSMLITLKAWKKDMEKAKGDVYAEPSDDYGQYSRPESKKEVEE